jgi:hypothetical protein
VSGAALDSTHSPEEESRESLRETSDVLHPGFQQRKCSAGPAQCVSYLTPGVWQAVARSAHVGHVLAINMLCEATAAAEKSPHEPDNHGWSPLHRAAYKGHREAVEALLNFRPIPASQAKPGAGCTPEERDLALRVDKRKGIVRVMVTPLDVAKDVRIRKVLQEALEADGSSKKANEA